MSNIVLYLINITFLYILGIYLKITYGIENYTVVKEYLKKKNINITKNSYMAILFILSILWGPFFILDCILISYKKIKN